MSLSTVDDIVNTVDYDPAGFQFLSTVGSLIGNREYSNSYYDFAAGHDNSRTFYWKALSAVGDRISETVYDNVRNYIQCVSDVDTCKIKSLRSMVQLFNYKCTVLDNFMNMPVEVLKLMDLLSIDKKYLRKAGFVKPECLADMASQGVIGEYREASYGTYGGIDFRSEFDNGQYIVSTDARSGNGCNVSQMQWPYSGPVCVSDFIGFRPAYDQEGKISGYVQDQTRLDQLVSYGYSLSSIQQVSAFHAGKIYTNAKGYRVIDDMSYQSGSRSRLYVLNGDLQGQFFIDAPYGAVRFPGDSVTSCLADVSAESDWQTSAYCNFEWISENGSLSVGITLSNEYVQFDGHTFDDDCYYKYVKAVFRNLLYGYIALPYNISVNYMTHVTPLYVYPNLGNEYFDISSSYDKYSQYDYGQYDETGSNTENAILSVKARNHISRQFNEKKIYDDIDAGKDSLDAYSGAELCVLLMEKSRRAAPLDSSICEGYGVTQFSLKQNQTRYSFYRERKVLEYARFVDSYYSMLSGSSAAGVYDFNTNYWQISSLPFVRVISKPSASGADPSRDINAGMIDVIADYLTMASLYVSRLRNEIKLQTQKNYMRGTNLLLIYIVNEYLRDYAKHNSLSGNILGEDDFIEIRGNLANHQLDSGTGQGYSVNVQEYYDSTEYFNIASDSTPSADMASKANARFWELTSFENADIMKGDGVSFALADIEKFYLSSLNLDRAVSGDLPAFLSTIYDVGANNTFICKNVSDELSIFSSVLSDGQFASDVFGRLVNLSSKYNAFVGTYLSSGLYKYPDSTVELQLSDVLSGFIYPNLSSQYLVGISDVYNGFKIKLDSLSGEIDSLSASYVRFTNTTYQCYYSKQQSKFCYADWDVAADVYVFPYFNGNPDYDRPDDDLYNRLYQLCAYSTQDNIQNFALISAVTYVNGALNDLFSSLRARVIQPLKESCGFVDINAPTFDSETQYTYNYINQLITNRQDFLNQQLKSLQTQAQNLKTQYDTLNNTFTNAVAGFNDNNAGYKLGDSVVYCVTLYQVEGGGNARRDKTSPSKAKWDKTLYVSEASPTPWYAIKSGWSGGEYSATSNTVRKYVSTDPLEARCDEVLEYMNAPTSVEQSGNKFYGLRNEGIVVVCDNVKAGLTDIQNSFDNVAQQAKSLFGVEKPTQSDIYKNILELVEKLTAVDETAFTADSLVMKYRGYLATVVELSSNYAPVKSEYNRIFTDKAQTAYLADFSKQEGLTFANIEELSLYIQKTDGKNYKAITEAISKFMNVDFVALSDKKTALQEEMQEAGVPNVWPYETTELERCVFDMMYNQYSRSGIVQDVIDKQNEAERKIADNKFLIYNQYGTGYVNAITSEISADMQSTKKLPTCVKSALDRLNFFGHDIYIKYREMFLTYGGRQFCYDPYYNMKNVTHPSYQIHPYLWNFVKKIDTTTLINSGFHAAPVAGLISDNAVDTVRKMLYFGEYGQTVNTWKASNDNLVDYSGYRSMYEREPNWSSKLNAVHEVVDYEGAFYPPAVAEYVRFPTQSVSSVNDMMMKAEIVDSAIRTVRNQFPGDIRQYVLFNDDGTVVPSSWSPFAAAISGQIARYVDASQCSFNVNINSYLQDATTTVSSIGFQGIYDGIRNGVPQTFYEKYYMQVDMTAGEVRRTAMQLTEYFDQISDIVSPKTETEQYDVYKYGIDINKTHYILFKKYDYSGVEDTEEMSYRLKRDTLGRMWIRQADHPIAFPAFSGANPAYYTLKTNELAPIVVKLAQKEPDGITWGDRAHESINAINSDMRYFYDFEIAANKASIAYVAFDPSYPVGNPFYSQFRLAAVAAAPIETYTDSSTGITYRKFCNSVQSDGKRSVDYIEFHKSNTILYTSDQDILSTDVLLSSGISYPALVGYHVFDNNSINFVYTYHDFKAEQNGIGFADKTHVLADSSTPLRSFAIQIDSGSQYRKIPAGNDTFRLYDRNLNGKRIVGDSTCIGYNMLDGKLTFAYVTENPQSAVVNVRTETISGTIDISACTEGAIITDPLAVEMNSHDVLAQNVTLVETEYMAKSIRLNSVRDYNTNADISYIPVYPGRRNEFNMPSCYGVYDEELSCRRMMGEYQNIQLLGRSKDIEWHLGLVNPDPDPYFDYETVVQNKEFGRVYEDYKREFEKTFTSVSNPGISDNSPGSFEGGKHLVTAGSDCFIWKVMLNMLNPTPFSMRDIRNMRVIIYNSDTMGKNPYYIGQLFDFVNQTALNYNDAPSVSETAEVTTSCIVTAGEVYVTGTTGDLRIHGRSGSNRLDHINGIDCVLYAEEGHLDQASVSFTFHIDEQDPLRRFAKVPRGKVKMILYNERDLDIYKYYHLLDAYGAVQCKYYDSLDDRPGQEDDGRGWGIYRPPAEHSDPSALMCSFFHDKRGLKQYLDSIELSDYDALSDVYVFRGNKMLSFKNEEEYRFPTSSDLYYFPSLNVSYPKKAANYVASDAQFQSADKAEISVMEGMFGEENLFSMVLEDAAYVADRIGQVDIPILYNDIDDVRVYEDYMSCQEVSAGLSVDNFATYDISDPRIAEYMHFTSDRGIEAGDGLSVGDEAWEKKTIDDFTAGLAQTSGVYSAKSQEVALGVEQEYITTYASRHTCDIQRFLCFHVNYRRDFESQSIVLYFNYFNYVDSPYVKMENGTDVKIDTIGSTYLKLAAGEDGALDIIVQFKYYVGDVLYGYRNVKVLSYRIYNISDDKPKFLMYKTYEIREGQASRQLKNGNVTISIDDMSIYLEEHPGESRITGQFEAVVYSDKSLSGNYDFYFEYPDGMFDITEDSGPGYYIDTEGSGLGILHVMVTNSSQKTYRFPFVTKYTATELAKYRNRKYSVSVIDATIRDCDGLVCDVKLPDSYVTFAHADINAIGANAVGSAAVGAFVAKESNRSIVRIYKTK